MGARDDPLRPEARFAEYAGWMAQESGQEKAALRLTARAATMAKAGDDHDLAVHALIRRPLVTLYRGDAGQTAAPARQAQADDHDLAVHTLIRRPLVTLYRGDAGQTAAPARQAQADDHDLAVHTLIRRPPRDALPRRRRTDRRAGTPGAGLLGDAAPHPRPAAQREAQGHAHAGDYDACMRGLDRAREFLGASGGSTGAPMLGPTNVPDTVTTLTGRCVPPRSRPAEGAAEILDAEVARIRPEALRSRAGYDARRALAHAAAGEVEHARADDAPPRHHLRPAPPGPDAVPR